MSMKLALIGTGQISHWHLEGLASLAQHLRERSGQPAPFDLVAIADPRPDARESLASASETKLGRRPAQYDTYAEMIERESLDAAALLVPHHLHWAIARDCLDAGLHLQVQKPIALTIAEGRRIIDYAREKGRTMVVSEPSVLGRETRATLAALRSGAIVGTPTFLLDYAVTTLGGGFFMGTPWRHLKGMAGAGWFLDHGVHRTHWFLEALGPVEEAFALARTFEPERRDEKHGTFKVDTEDCAMTCLRFAGGALGHFLVASAGRGTGFGAVRLYGTDGVLDFGGGGTVYRDGEPAEAARRLGELATPYHDDSIPGDAMAHSFLELHELITSGKPPISSGERALEALAVIYACLEAATTNSPARVADVLSGAAHAYEDTIEAARPTLADLSADRVS
jgi:UDP-N-acetyl-2-amino-2-deoxyglucuronate dehydrogenase